MGASEKTHIIVVRHGETEWNRDKIFQGQLDSPLSELGIKQAQAVAHALKDETIDAAYSSDLGRAAHTAKIIVEPHGLNVAFEQRLRERHLGVFQGLKKEEIKSRFGNDLDQYRSGDPNHVIPGGESSRQRYERSTSCLLDIVKKHEGKQILIVTHGGVLRGFLEMTLKLPMNRKRHFSLYNASIARFSVIKDHWMMHSWGETHHLRDLDIMDDF